MIVRELIELLSQSHINPAHSLQMFISDGECYEDIELTEIVCDDEIGPCVSLQFELLEID